MPMKLVTRVDYSLVVQPRGIPRHIKSNPFHSIGHQVVRTARGSAWYLILFTRGLEKAGKKEEEKKKDPHLPTGSNL